MSVYRPKGRRFWLYDFQLNGTRFHGSTGKTTKRDATAVEHELRKKHAQHQDTLLAACALYENYAKNQPSFKTTEYQLDRLLDMLGENTLISDIGDPEVENYVTRRRGQKSKRGTYPSPATINREVELLRRVLRRAKKPLKVEVQDIDWGARKLREPLERVRVLTDDERERLMAELQPYLIDVVWMGLLTGLRLSNITKLDWSQVSMTDRRMVFVLKGGRHHSIKMNSAVFAIMLRQGPKKTGRVFLRNGEPIKSFKTAWRGAKRRAGIEDFRFHDTRHTFGSAVARKKGIGLARKALGHASISSTIRYAHFEDDDIVDALDAATPDIAPDKQDVSA